MKIVLMNILFFGLRFISFSQDTTFLKITYAGNKLTVPENKIWTVNRVFISEGGQYAIQTQTNNFSPSYNPNDTILIPYYIPEMELLTNKDLVQFHLYIAEYNLK